MPGYELAAARYRADVATGTGGFVDPGGGGGGGGGPATPNADTLTDLPGWHLQATTNFPALSVAAGAFLSNPAYGGTATANDIGKMKFSAYPFTFGDSRSKHLPGRTVTACKTFSTSPAVYGVFSVADIGRGITGTGIPSGTMILAYDATGPNINGYGTGPRITMSRNATGTSAALSVAVLSGVQKKTVANLTTFIGDTHVSTDADTFITVDVGRTLNSVNITPRSTIVTVTDARNAIISTLALASATATSNIGQDYGSYDVLFAVQDGILSAPIFTDDLGIHHVCAPYPKLNGLNASPWGVVGGRFEQAFRCASVLNTYKDAHLLWPDSGHSTSGTTAPSPPGTGLGGNGEIDFPETNFTSSAKVGGFMHWQDGTGQQSTASSTQLAVDAAWHIYTIEWRPNADRVSSTLEFFIDGVSIKKFTGVNVPNQPMHWILQCETTIADFTVPVDPSMIGKMEWGYMAFWTMV